MTNLISSARIDGTGDLLPGVSGRYTTSRLDMWLGLKLCTALGELKGVKVILEGKGSTVPKGWRLSPYSVPL